ncbi:MAG: DNA alkylation repair protein [Coriobacteriia bacterium]|nr:DNA alkylation repair protein [Coriobacteriia bacterium]MCL2750252.1 DNA alkylation repair protein [Coriobacteriia bacterium]
MNNSYEELFALFKEHADVELAAEMSAYMRSLFPFLGIKTPVRRKLSSTFIKAAKKESQIDWEFVSRCWELEREFQYLALDYLQAVSKLLVREDIPRLRELVIAKSWWDTVDALDSFIGNIVFGNPELKKLMIAWSLDDNLWIRRIAINHQLQHKDKTDTALFEQILVNNFGQNEFFINKAIGWSLREYSKTDAPWVSDFLARYEGQLAPLSVREASKYLN